MCIENESSSYTCIIYKYSIKLGIMCSAPYSFYIPFKVLYMSNNQVKAWDEFQKLVRSLLIIIIINTLSQNVLVACLSGLLLYCGNYNKFHVKLIEITLPGSTG